MIQNIRKISQIFGVIFTLVLLAAGIWYFNFILVASGLLLSVFMGRYFCGWFCPMGTFAERVLVKISKNRPPHKIFSSKPFQYAFAVFFFAAIFIARKNFHSLYVVLGMMLSVGIMATLLAIFYQPRTWCGSLCPWGTVMTTVSFNRRFKLEIGEDCKNCRVCTKVCNIPQQLHQSLDERKEKSGKVYIGDRCINCLACVEKCPTKQIKIKE
ncbi:4Fe-4S binding protein [Anaerobranca gottschalkii]|uniref:4Fe-4S binding domain-containing protein n=1 Tax=Anaerobranca gottschalkii DSM 13577 TaxID=1120990 RepID=A0A1H9ZR84_9FIRM|nr:4Fe-4S binding protein [Anaerobranca gottschalkii]SES84273.1 4Fe-4S binding domain-containing protein [Anaerobranca gottschalkii DSM 13577]